MVERALRPFWLHQIAEYIVGAALIGSGLQSPSPVVPAIVGGAILLEAAMVDGPLGAFRVVGRRLHRVLDMVLVVVGFAGILVPGLDLGTRVVLLCCMVVYATVVWNTSYAPTRAREETSVDARSHADDRPDRIGRSAGRVAGTLAGRARARWRSSRSSSGD